MLSYLCLGTNDFERALRFYDAVLGAMGLQRTEAFTDGHPPQHWAGYRLTPEGAAQPQTLFLCTPFNRQPASAGNGSMVALQARSWQAVDAAHAAALAHGGVSEGEPGLRTHYGPDFYAAYVRDPDGNKLALLCRGFTSREEARAAGA